MSAKKKTGLTRLANAFGYSLDGLKAAFRSEPAFRQELLLLAIATPVAFLATSNPLERALMISSLLLVLIVEIVNTAVETTIERISAERHDLSKKAKDLGSAAVLLALLNALVIWAVILVGPLLQS